MLHRTSACPVGDTEELPSITCYGAQVHFRLPETVPLFAPAWVRPTPTKVISPERPLSLTVTTTLPGRPSPTFASKSWRSRATLCIRNEKLTVASPGAFLTYVLSPPKGGTCNVPTWIISLSPILSQMTFRSG